jgi:hypothetical protein
MMNNNVLNSWINYEKKYKTKALVIMKECEKLPGAGFFFGRYQLTGSGIICRL